MVEAAGTLNGGITTLTRSNDYIIGPVAELRVPFGFALEVDGLYRGSEFDLTTITLPQLFRRMHGRSRTLLSFVFPIPLLKPFVSAGGAYRSFTDLPTNVTPTHNAFVLGGMELRISKLRLPGELRWLHWNSPSTNNVVRLTENQGEVLFGLVFSVPPIRKLIFESRSPTSFRANSNHVGNTGANFQFPQMFNIAVLGICASITASEGSTVPGRVAHSGVGQPQLQLFAGLNLQFPTHRR